MPYSLYRGFVLLPSKIVLLDPLHGATLRLRRWPPPLGPPTDLMPGHLSPACGLTTLNATHLRDGQSRRSSSLRELGISIVRAVRASTPDLLRAWCRSLAGRQPLGLGEDVGRVAGSAPRAQQLSGLQEHDTNYYRPRGCNTVHGEEHWCYKPEGLLHHRRLVQYLSMVIRECWS